MKLRILLVDNDSQLNAINQKVLTTSGFVQDVHTVSNGRDALMYLNTRIEKNYPLPDLIILDINLPLVNGFQFLEAYRQLEFTGKSRIHIVVFTASSNPHDRQRSIELGVKHYLHKPYLLRELKEIIYHFNIGHSAKQTTY